MFVLEFLCLMMNNVAKCRMTSLFHCTSWIIIKLDVVDVIWTLKQRCVLNWMLIFLRCLTSSEPWTNSNATVEFLQRSNIPPNKFFPYRDVRFLKTLHNRLYFIQHQTTFFKDKWQSYRVVHFAKTVFQ